MAHLVFINFCFEALLRHSSTHSSFRRLRSLSPNTPEDFNNNTQPRNHQRRSHSCPSSSDTDLLRRQTRARLMPEQRKSSTYDREATEQKKFDEYEEDDFDEEEEDYTKHRTHTPTRGKQVSGFKLQPKYTKDLNRMFESKRRTGNKKKPSAGALNKNAEEALKRYFLKDSLPEAKNESNTKVYEYYSQQSEMKEKTVLPHLQPNNLKPFGTGENLLFPVFKATKNRTIIYPIMETSYTTESYEQKIVSDLAKKSNSSTNFGQQREYSTSPKSEQVKECEEIIDSYKSTNPNYAKKEGGSDEKSFIKKTLELITDYKGQSGTKDKIQGDPSRDLQTCKEIIAEYKRMNPDYTSPVLSKTHKSGFTPRCRDGILRSKSLQDVRVRPLHESAPMELEGVPKKPDTNEPRAERKKYSFEDTPMVMPEVPITPIRVKVGPKANLLQSNAMPESGQFADSIKLEKNERLTSPWPSYAELVREQYERQTTKQDETVPEEKVLENATDEILKDVSCPKLQSSTRSLHRKTHTLQEAKSSKRNRRPWYTVYKRRYSTHHKGTSNNLFPDRTCDEISRDVNADCPCVEPSVPVDVPPLRRLKKRCTPKEATRVCRVEECPQRADNHLKPRLKPLKKIIPGDCPCVPQEVKPGYPLPRLKKRSLSQVPPRVCPCTTPDCYCPPRADAGLKPARKRLAKFVPMDCPCVQPEPPVDTKPLKQLKKVKFPDPSRCQPTPPRYCQVRADDRTQHQDKRLPKLRLSNCPCVEPPPLTDVRMRRLKKVVLEDTPKFCPEVVCDETLRADALAGYQVKPKCLPPLLGARKVRKPRLNVSHKKARKPHLNVSHKRRFGTYSRQTALEMFCRNYSSRKYVSPNPDCPCKQPSKPSEAPRLKRLPKFKKEDVNWKQQVECTVEPCPERADSSLKQRHRVLPRLQPSRCPCAQTSSPDEEPKLKRLPKFEKPDVNWRKLEECVVPSCPARADAARTEGKKSLPKLPGGDCPCPSFSQTQDAGPLKRLPKYTKEDRNWKKLTDCQVEPCPPRADSALKDQRKCLPKLKPSACTCTCTETSVPDKSPKMKRLPKFQKEDINWKKVCPTERCPDRSDDALGYQVKKKPLAAILTSIGRKSFHTLPAYVVAPHVPPWNTTRFKSMKKKSSSKTKLKKAEKPETKKCQKMKVTKTKCPKMGPLKGCQPPARTTCEVDFIKPCTKQNSPYPAFSECAEAGELPSCECGPDLKFLQPKYPILNEVEIQPAPPPEHDNIDVDKEKFCVMKKLGMKSEGETRTCEDFNKPHQEFKGLELLKQAECEAEKRAQEQGTSLAELSLKARKEASCKNKAKAGKMGVECPVVDTDTCSINYPVLSEPCAKSKKRPPTPECPKPKSVTPAKVVTCVKPAKRGFFQRILDFFKPRPNCPKPDEWKKKKLREEAERAAKAAGLKVCDPCAKKPKKPKCIKKKSKCTPKQPKCTPKKEKPTCGKKSPGGSCKKLPFKCGAEAKPAKVDDKPKVTKEHDRPKPIKQEDGKPKPPSLKGASKVRKMEPKNHKKVQSGGDAKTDAGKLQTKSGEKKKGEDPHTGCAPLAKRPSKSKGCKGEGGKDSGCKSKKEKESSGYTSKKTGEASFQTKKDGVPSFQTKKDGIPSLPPKKEAGSSCKPTKKSEPSCNAKKSEAGCKSTKNWEASCKSTKKSEPSCNSRKKSEPSCKFTKKPEPSCPSEPKKESDCQPAKKSKCCKPKKNQEPEDCPKSEKTDVPPGTKEKKPTDQKSKYEKMFPPNMSADCAPKAKNGPPCDKPSPGKKPKSCGGKPKQESPCPKVDMGCPPRARDSCESDLIDKPCKAQVAPYPSYSECRPPFPRPKFSECKIARERARRTLASIRPWSSSKKTDGLSRKYSTLSCAYRAMGFHVPIQLRCCYSRNPNNRRTAKEPKAIHGDQLNKKPLTGIEKYEGYLEDGPYYQILKMLQRLSEEEVQEFFSVKEMSPLREDFRETVAYVCKLNPRTSRQFLATDCLQSRSLGVSDLEAQREERRLIEAFRALCAKLCGAEAELSHDEIERLKKEQVKRLLREDSKKARFE